MKKLLRKMLPKKFILIYHYLMAVFATLYYGFPSKKMVIIGVTGTKGKTSTVNFIWSCLTAGGHKTGIISTANIRIGEKESLNKYHMTMPGRFTIQKLMAEMVKNGCKFCVIETTSEGIKQHRHTGVYYDIAVFTNLSPEHLPSHGGSFKKYKEAKGKMFEALSSHRKYIDGREIEKVIIANNDDEHADYFLNFKAGKKVTFAIKNKADYVATDIDENGSMVGFSVRKIRAQSNIFGYFNIYNILPAIIIGDIFRIDKAKTVKGIHDLKVIPGRMEKIDEGQPFIVLVDYAHEGKSMRAAITTARKLVHNHGKVIVLLGAEGGGRDKQKRPIMGKVAGEFADFVIVSVIDSYDDEPVEINEEIAIASEQAGKIREKNLFVITDRRDAIRKALSIAGDGDVVMITGKGSEQTMSIYGKVIQWDDRSIVREELKSIYPTR